jgi:hypothetical protein
MGKNGNQNFSKGIREHLKMMSHKFGKFLTTSNKNYL